MGEKAAGSPTSPVVKKAKDQPGMSFYSALRKLVGGKKITRDDWEDPEIYGYLKDGRVVIHGGPTGDGKDHPWTINEGDLKAEDWKVL